MRRAELERRRQWQRQRRYLNRCGVFDLVRGNQVSFYFYNVHLVLFRYLALINSKQERTRATSAKKNQYCGILCGILFIC